MNGDVPSEGAETGAPVSRRLRDKLRRSGYAYLNRYAASTAHFSSVMTRKLDRWAGEGLFDRETTDVARLVADLVAEFAEFGLIDDAAFAEGRAASMRRKGGSRLKIVYGLRAKGIDAAMAGAAIAASDVDETQAALNLCRRRRIGPWRRDGVPVDRDARNREIALLVRQGFAYALARSVIGMERQAAEDRLACPNGDPDAVDG